MTPLLDLYRHRHRFSATQAERRQASLQPARPERMEQRHQDARAAAADRMPQGDSPAVDVDSVPVQSQILAIGEGLRGKGLVQLDQVKIVQAQPLLFNNARMANAGAVKMCSGSTAA